jgi:L-lactate permease
MKMMRPQIRTERALETAAAATATLKKIMDMKKILRRSTLPANIAETFALCGDLYKFVN